MKKINNWKNINLWAHGLVAAFVTGFTGALATALANPGAFAFSKAYFLLLAKGAVPPGLVGAFLYMKTSPVPALSVEVETKTTVDVTPK